MEMAKIKTHLNDFKKRFNKSSYDEIDWYLVTDTGVMYSNLPPRNLIRLDETNDCLLIFKLEDQMGPTQTFSYTIITTETINTVGTHVRKKETVQEILSEKFKLPEQDVIYYIQDMFTDDFVKNPNAKFEVKK